MEITNFQIMRFGNVFFYTRGDNELLCYCIQLTRQFVEREEPPSSKWPLEKRYPLLSTSRDIKKNF